MGNAQDNTSEIKHRCNTSPPTIAYSLHLHRGSENIDTVTPEYTPSDRAALLAIIVANGPDSALNAWAAGIGGALGTWWSANILGTGTRWTTQIRDVVA